MQIGRDGEYCWLSILRGLPRNEILDYKSRGRRLDEVITAVRGFTRLWLLPGRRVVIVGADHEKPVGRWQWGSRACKYPFDPEENP